MKRTRCSWLVLVLWISQASKLESIESCPEWRTCPGHNVQYARSKLKNALPWSNAKRACEKLGDGVHLATPRNDGENTCVFDQIGSNEKLWIGLKSMSVRQYTRSHTSNKRLPPRYIDDNTLVGNSDYQNWTEGQPDWNRQSCIAGWNDKKHKQIGWDDDFCNIGHYPALCEIKGDAPLNGWTKCPGQNVLYQKRSDRNTWAEAKANCENAGNGAHLATPRNPQQSQCVHELRGSETAWLGMAKFLPFKYVDNDKSLANFFNWTKEQPANIFVEHCAIARKSQDRKTIGWSSENCSIHRQFVCQRKVRCIGAPQTLPNTQLVEVLDKCGNQTMMSYQCRHGYSYNFQDTTDTLRIIHCDGHFPKVNFSCHEINECSLGTHTCAAMKDGGQCNNTIGSFNCSCRHGYLITNDHKCLDVDECQTGLHKCTSSELGGQCTNTNGSYTCSCRHDYTGNGFDNTTNSTSCARLCLLTNFSHGQQKYELPPTNVGAFVQFTCNQSDGYTLSGVDRLMCLYSSEWAGALPTCNRISCGCPEKPNFGLVHGSDFAYGAKVTYSCINDYRLEGSQTITCGKNGSWSGLSPKCVRLLAQTPNQNESKSSSTSSGLSIPSVIAIATSELLLFIMILLLIIKRKRSWTVSGNKKGRHKGTHKSSLQDDNGTHTARYSAEIQTAMTTHITPSNDGCYAMAGPATSCLSTPTEATVLLTGRKHSVEQQTLMTSNTPEGEDLYATASPGVRGESLQTPANEYLYASANCAKENASSMLVNTNEAVYDSPAVAPGENFPAVDRPPPASEDGTYQRLAKSSFSYLARINVLVGKEQLSSGEFSDMFKGSFRKDDDTVKQAAVKVLKHGLSLQMRSKFLQEASILGCCKHTNIVKLFGVVGDNDGHQALIVLELMESDLKSFLTKDGQRPANIGMMLLVMAQDVATGMAFLASKRVVHRNLTAQGVLIDKHNKCKIGSFGMARELGDDGYYKCDGEEIAVRWTAPEANHCRQFSSASDVWSFGVVLYEAYSFGENPYGDWSTKKVIQEVDKGYRLPKLHTCPCVVYEIMMNCWNITAHDRPTFTDIVEVLDSL